MAQWFFKVGQTQGCVLNGSPCITEAMMQSKVFKWCNKFCDEWIIIEYAKGSEWPWTVRTETMENKLITMIHINHLLIVKQHTWIMEWWLYQYKAFIPYWLKIWKCDAYALCECHTIWHANNFRNGSMCATLGYKCWPKTTHSSIELSYDCQQDLDLLSQSSDKTWEHWVEDFTFTNTKEALSNEVRHQSPAVCSLMRMVLSSDVDFESIFLGPIID